MHNPVIISDLDGTLLNSNNVIPPATLDWIARWTADGGQFIVATGRHYQNIKNLFDGCTHAPQLITSNGAMINDRLALSAESCRVEHLPEMAALGWREQLHFSVFTEAGWHVTSRDAVVNTHDFDAILTDTADFVHLPAFKALFYGEPSALKALQRHLHDQFPELRAVQSDPYWLEVQRKSINKFSALQDFLVKRNIVDRPTLAFGDGLNDLELLAGCTQGVIMGNAMPELKASLPELPIALSHDAEGVRNYLESFLQ